MGEDDTAARRTRRIARADHVGSVAEATCHAPEFRKRRNEGKSITAASSTAGSDRHDTDRAR